MRTASLLALGGLLLMGCKEEAQPPAPAAPPAKAPAGDPRFDSAWSGLAQKGVETLYIEDDRGQGLMGNVRRAAAPPAAALAPAPPSDPAAALPELPAGESVNGVIKQNLAAVKSCYLMVSRDGSSRSGKAIVSFEIGADGQPTAVKVEAPAFEGTSLGKCVSSQVAHWSFPKSQKGGLAVSYPFVFVGG